VRFVDHRRIVSAVSSKGAVVVVAPTGTGKTHATLLAAGELLRRGVVRRVYVTEPTRAAVYEVWRKASAMYGAHAVGRDDSDARLDAGWRRSVEWSKPIVVTTYEKMDSVANIDPTVLSDALLVIDEAHQILMRDRSTPIIDLMALGKMQGAKMVLLSATMPEMEEITSYLGGELYVHEAEREIVVETVFAEPWGRGAQSYYSAKLGALLDLISKEKITKDDAPMLVYVPSRKWSEYVADVLAKSLGDEWTVAVHHAGRPYMERRRIENELRKKKPGIDIVVATDTLSQAVNMAFKTVVVLGMTRFLKGGVVFQEPAIIRQVIGRAGRPEYSERGRAVIIYSYDERPLVEKALNRVYGEVTGADDYLALVLRLRATGRDPDIWARYAYKVDKAKMERAMRVAEEVGLISGGELTQLGTVMAVEYLPGRAAAALVLLTSTVGEEIRARLQPVDSVYFMATTISFYASKMWTQVQSITVLQSVIESKLGQRVVHISNVADEVVSSAAETGAYETEVGDALARLADLYLELSEALEYVTPPINAYLAIASPGVGDDAAESMRKAAQVVETMARVGLATPQEGAAARALQRVAKAVRLLHRTAPDYVMDFVEKALSTPPEVVARYKHNQLVKAYILSKTDDVPFMDALRRVAGTGRRRAARRDAVSY